MSTDPNATSLTIDRATGKRPTHTVGWHKKFGKAWQLPILIHVHSTERNDGDDPTGFHDMCLRSSQWHVWWTTCSSSSSAFQRSTWHLISGCKHFQKDPESHLFWNAAPLKHLNGFSPRLHLTLPMHQWSSSCHPTGWSFPSPRKWHLRPRCSVLAKHSRYFKHDMWNPGKQPVEPPQTTSNNSKFHPEELPSPPHHTSFFRGCIRDRQSPTWLGETSIPHENGTCRAQKTRTFSQAEMLQNLKTFRILESKYYLAMGRKKYEKVV